MKWPAAVLLIFAICPPASTQTEKGLVGYWSFDEGQGREARDGSGLCHHGQIQGGAAWVPGRQGTALELNGIDSAVRMSGADTLNLQGDATFTAWVRTTSDDGRDRLIFGDIAGQAVHRNLSIELDRGSLVVGHGNDTLVESLSPKLQFDGQWKHLAIILEHPRYYLYVDGQLSDVGTLAMPLSRTRSGGFLIGGWWAGWFKGAIDEVRLYNRALSHREVLALVPGMAPVASPAVRVSVSPRFKTGELGLEAFLPEIAAESGHVEFTLTSQGQSRPDRSASARWRISRPGSERAWAEASTSMAGLAGGRYLLAATARDAAGKQLVSVQKDVVIPSPPAWFGSKAGRTEDVLGPYTPIEVATEGKGVHIDVWGRRYQLGNRPFPERVISGRSALLAEPMQLRAVVDGKEVSWSTAAPSVREAARGRAILDQRVTAGPITWQTESQVEYDGFLRIQCVLSSRIPVKIGALVMEIPMKAELARYLYTWPTTFGGGGYSGRLSGAMQFGFHPILWTGDEDRGLAWMCESEDGWAPEDPGKAIEVIPGSGRALVRIHVIGRSTTLVPGQSLRYVFALQATPVKPMGPDGWELRFAGSPWYGLDYDLLKGRDFLGQPGLVRLKQLGVRTLIVTNWTPVLAYPGPLDRAADFKALVEACHAQGIRIIPYLGYQISEKAPEYPWVKDEVVVSPVSTNPDKYPGMEPQMVSSVCLRSVWRDALVEGVKQMMDTLDIDGVYLDSTNMPFACMNRRHGCEACRLDGTPVPVYPVFEVRETFRRLYAVVKARKADGIVDSHVFDCMNPGSLSFSTFYWNGEQLSEAAVPSDSLPLDRFRTEFLGTNWGVPGDLLFYKLGDFRKALAISLPHDVLVRSWQGDLLASQALWKLADDFGRREAQFTPYYRRASGLAGLPKDCIASVYRHPRHGALAIVSNPGRQETRMRLKPDWKSLGIARPGPIVDGLTRARIPLIDGSLEVTLPAAGWQYLWFQEEK